MRRYWVRKLLELKLSDAMTIDEGGIFGLDGHGVRDDEEKEAT